MCLSNGDVHYPMAPPSDSLAEFEESCHIVTGWIWLVGIEHTCTKQSALWKDLLQQSGKFLTMVACHLCDHGCWSVTNWDDTPRPGLPRKHTHTNTRDSPSTILHNDSFQVKASEANHFLLAKTERSLKPSRLLGRDTPFKL